MEKSHTKENNKISTEEGRARLIKLDRYSYLGLIFVVVMSLATRLFLRNVDWVTWVILPIIFVAAAVFGIIRLYVCSETMA